MTFRDPLFFFFLLLVPVFFYLYWRQQRAPIRFSSLASFKKIGGSWKLKARPLLELLPLVSMILLIIALARPQKGIEETQVETEGIDVALVVDLSSSMLAEDFTLNGKYVNRLEVVKEAVKKFIEGRAGDRLGLILFAGRPYTQCPLTLDYGVLQTLLENAQIGMIEDGTAIGSALATAVNRLKETKSKSKVIILLTDGINNAGNIDPLTAASLAKTYGIKVYTIAAGNKGKVRFPSQDFFGNKAYRPVEIPIDEPMLKKIAETTGGAYFRATDTKLLFDVYKKIDQLEKTKAKVNVYVDYHELYVSFVLASLFVFLMYLILNHTVLRKVP